MPTYQEARQKIVDDAIKEDPRLEYYPQKYKMTQRDVDTIKFIENVCFVKGMSDADKMPHYIEAQEVLAYRKAGIIVACVLFKQEKHNTITIEDLIVSPNEQRGGFGSKLLSLVTHIADETQMQVKLESPPRNHEYYSCFGFKVCRDKYRKIWPAEDNKGNIFPIQKLAMWRNPNSAHAYHNNKEKPETMAGMNSEQFESDKNAIINIVKKLARFGRNATSAWYRSFFHSSEKEKAQCAIEEELAIYASDISQKRKLTQADMQAIIRAIIKNAMVVRGFRKNVITKSGLAIYNLISKEKPMGNFSQAEVNVIKTILALDEHCYTSYEALRKTLFNGQDYHSTKEESSYWYHNDFEKHKQKTGSTL